MYEGPVKENGDDKGKPTNSGDQWCKDHAPNTNTGTGRVTVIKKVIGGEGIFHFNGLNQQGGFDISATPEQDGVTSFVLPSDTQYTLSEVIPDGWDLTNASCEEFQQISFLDSIRGLFSPSVAYATQVSINEQTFTLNKDKNINCVFTNTKKPEPSIIVIAKKVVCDAEEYLPNYGYGGPNVTSTTADDWVAQSEGHCQLDPNWKFQWGDQSAPDGGATTIGEVSGYTTFNANTPTAIPLTNITELRLREVLKEGYIPFIGRNTTEDVSAEFYCADDVLHYDNWDFIRNPIAGTTYHCVGFNAPVETPQEPQQCDFVSDETNITQNNSNAVPTWTHSAWANSTLLGNAAKWIWNAYKVLDSTINETETFTKKFNVGGDITSATLELAVDNGYQVEINNIVVTGTEKLDTEFNYGSITSPIDVSSYLISGLNTIKITVKNIGVPSSNAESNPAGLLYKLHIVSGTCSDAPSEPQPQFSTVTMCKTDDAEQPKNLSGWTLMLKGSHVEDLSVDSSNPLGTNTSNSLVAGISYIAKTMGTWLNQGGANPVDTEYSTTDGWATHMDGYTGYSTDILELQIDNKFDPNSNWGAYNSLHKYAQSFVPASSSSNFRIFDGTGTTQNIGWFGDNSGSLNVGIYKGYAGITGENGCVTFNNVPYGSYTVDEIMQDGWSNVSGLGEVTVDSSTETFTVVNHDDSIVEEETTGTLTIQKYNCPANFVPNRDDNGVGGDVPEGCTPASGVGFEYTYDSSNDTNNTGPYLGLFGDETPFSPLSLTNESGLSINADKESAGRYIVREVDPTNLLGLYCVGDGDTNPNNNDNQEITFVEVGGTDVNCVAYNKTTGGGGDQETNSSNTTVVKAGDLAPDLAAVISTPTKWFFYNDENDTINNTLGSFVTGPSTAPEGSGSAQISVSGTQRRNLATYQFSGVKLENIKTLKFSTYNPSAGNGGSVNRSAYLNFNVDFDGSDTWQKRLAFVPNQNGSVTQDIWQEWDAIDGGNAKYSYSGTTWPGTATPGTTLRTWDDLVTSYPGIRIRVTDSWFGLRVGEPYSDGYTENLDKFIIAIKTGLNTHTETYDFEPTESSPEPIECDPGFHLEGETCVPNPVQTFGGGGGGGGGLLLLLNNNTPQGQVLGASTSCGIYLDDFLKMGKKNNKEQVKKLQQFLNDYLNLNPKIKVDGVFGFQTFKAVVKFQEGESLLVLKPWVGVTIKDAKKGTGWVYKTTKTRINNIMCPELNLSIPPLTID
ncbi:peptidoglycan-binding protein [Candidatus Nomurabacteria bacterium]|nr:peptidoglycan-binding protein [Candidatus Nomurabacteria bacterium]